jgi:hypothetical protein
MRGLQCLPFVSLIISIFAIPQILIVKAIVAIHHNLKMGAEEMI